MHAATRKSHHQQCASPCVSDNLSPDACPCDALRLCCRERRLLQGSVQRRRFGPRGTMNTMAVTMAAMATGNRMGCHLRGAEGAEGAEGNKQVTGGGGNHPPAAHTAQTTILSWATASCMRHAAVHRAMRTWLACCFSSELAAAPCGSGACSRGRAAPSSSSTWRSEGVIVPVRAMQLLPERTRLGHRSWP